MLSLTRKTEYALIALWQLARSNGDVVSARDIAEQHRVPLPLLMNVLKSLHRKGLVKSVRGASGGYKLAVSPAEVSLQGLIEAVEGPVKLIRCATHGGNGEPVATGEECCELLNGCPIRAPVQRVHDRFVHFLSHVSLAELIQDEGFTELRTPRIAAKV